MKHLDLFSGIGGFALAASWVWGEEHEIHSFVEIEPFAQKVLKKHWPDVPIHEDIKTYEHDGTPIDIISGGFPCQPYSVAGEQRGSEDDRALWPEMLRVIETTKPNWIVGENVAGFVNMGLDGLLSDLESQGYETTAFVLPACSRNAQHRRDRIWIIANSERSRLEKLPERYRKIKEIFPSTSLTAHPTVRRVDRRGDIGINRGDNGISERVGKFRGLGNAIVPQVVVPIFQAIKQIEVVAA